MGLYDKGMDFDPKKYFLGAQRFLPAIIGAIAALLVVWFLWGLFAPEPITFSFSKNPIKNMEQTVLEVTVANTTGATAQSVVIEVFPEDKPSISVGSQTQTIPVLDQYRKLEFVINPVGQTLAGNYVLNIKTEINGKKFFKQAVLTIEK
ncbi:MAG: hypothetical protein AABW85_00425 [archaeon]